MMSLMNYEPYRLLNRSNDFSRLFNDFFPRVVSRDTAAVHDWTPAVDIKEEDGRYLIHADVPGIKPEDIDVSLEDGVLTIKGERKFDNEETKDGYKRVERVRGSFHRRFSLPDTADQNKVSAKYSDGVLEVSIEKQEKLQPKKITVNS